MSKSKKSPKILLHPCFFCKHTASVVIEAALNDDNKTEHFAICGSCGACSGIHKDRKAALDSWLDINRKLTEIK